MLKTRAALSVRLTRSYNMGTHHMKTHQKSDRATITWLTPLLAALTVPGAGLAHVWRSKRKACPLVSTVRTVSGDARSTPKTPSAKPKRAQSKFRALRTVLLVAPLALAATSGANAQPILTSGTNFTGTLTSPPFTEIQGTNTITNISGNAVFVGAEGVLTIDSTTGMPGPIVITGTGFPVIVQSQGPPGGGGARPPATLTMNGANVISGAPSNGGVLVGGGFANLNPSTAKLMNVTIDAVSPGFAGLLVNRGCSATMTGGSITITGNGNPAAGSGPSPPNGIVAAAGVMTNSRGQATLSGVAIMTHGSNSPAVDVEAQITSDEGMLNPAGGPITITGGSITTLGANSFGVLANAVGGTVTLDGTPITTSGDGAAGFFANAGTITATNTTTQTSGVAAPGGILSNGGTLTINGGSVTTTGPGSFGFLVQPATAPPLTPSSPGPNMLQISNATVNAAADAFHVTGAVADITVDRSTIMSGNRVLLMADSASTVDVNILDNSIVTGVIEGAHNLFIDPSTWITPNDSFITGNLTLQGRLIFASAAKFAATGEASVLTVGGNYRQAASGTLALGIGGLQGEQYDHVLVGGNASLAGNLIVSSLGGFHPSAGNAFEVLHTNGTVSGNLGLNDSQFNTNPNITPNLHLIPIEVVAKNGVLLVYTETKTPSPPIIEDEPGLVLPAPNPEEPLPSSLLLAALDPTAEQLTSLFEIGFSAANTQRFKLDERFDQIQRDAAGYLSNTPPPPLPVPATGKEIASKQPVAPTVRPDAPTLLRRRWRRSRLFAGYLLSCRRD